MLKILVIPILLIFHPVHVTVTTIDQAQDSDSLKVFFRMYYDDFLRDCKLFNPESNPEKISADRSLFNDVINKYFNSRVRIYVNNKLLHGKLLTADIIYDEICLNLVYMSDRNPKKIKIRHQVSIALYSDQTNMIFININKNKEAMRLTPERFKEMIRLR
jgi:hypothetical protein